MKAGSLIANAGLAVAMILFGASVVATRVVVQDMSPLSLAFLRFGQGGLLLFLFLVIGARNLLRVQLHDLPFLALLGAILFAVFPVTFNAGFRFTEASRGAIMLSTMPLWSAWLARGIRKERLIPRQVGGILLTIAGVGLVLTERGLTWEGTSWAIAGDGLLLLTALLGATHGVMVPRALDRYSALTVTTYTMVFGALFLLPAALAQGLSFQSLAQLDGKAAALILFLGIFGGTVGYFLWTFGFSRLTPTQVTVYVNLNPVVATILGAVLLAERLTLLFTMGFVAVLTGVLLVNWPKKY